MHLQQPPFGENTGAHKRVAIAKKCPSTESGNVWNSAQYGEASGAGAGEDTCSVTANTERLPPIRVEAPGSRLSGAT